MSTILPIHLNEVASGMRRRRIGNGCKNAHLGAAWGRCPCAALLLCTAEDAKLRAGGAQRWSKASGLLHGWAWPELWLGEHALYKALPLWQCAQEPSAQAPPSGLQLDGQTGPQRSPSLVDVAQYTEPDASSLQARLSGPCKGPALSCVGLCLARPAWHVQAIAAPGSSQPDACRYTEDDFKRSAARAGVK